MCTLFVDEIYLNWATFVKTLMYKTSNKKKRFDATQEIVGKDVKRAFGILKSHRGHNKTLYVVYKCCKV